MFLILSALYFMLNSPVPSYASKDPMTAAGVMRFRENTVAPEFEIKEIGGRQLRLKDLRGKIVLLDFWATW